MKKKELYEQPNVDVLTLQFEGVICQSTDPMTINDWADGTDFPIIF